MSNVNETFYVDEFFKELFNKLKTKNAIKNKCYSIDWNSNLYDPLSQNNLLLSSIMHLLKINLVVPTLVLRKPKCNTNQSFHSLPF